MQEENTVSPDSTSENYEIVPDDFTIQLNKYRRFRAEKYLRETTIPFSIEYYTGYLRHLSVLNLPANLKHPFFTDKTFTLYLVTPTPFVLGYDDWLKNRIKITGASEDNTESIRIQFSQWLLAELPQEREHHFQKIMRSLKRNQNEHSFLRYLYAAMVFSERETADAHELVQEQLQLAEAVFRNAAIGSEISVLSYRVIRLTQGILALRTGYYPEALEVFSEIAGQEPEDSALNYLIALTAIQTGDISRATIAVQKIFQNDVLMLNYGIQYNSIPVIEFVHKYASVYSVLAADEFYPLDSELREMLSVSSDSLLPLPAKVAALEEFVKKETVLSLMDDQSMDSLRLLQFIRYAIETRKTQLLSTVSGKIFDKVFEVASVMKNRIEEYYDNEIEKTLISFDSALKTLKEKEARIEEDIQRSIRTLEQQYELKKKRLEDHTRDHIKNLERSIEQISNEENLRPKRVLISSMGNNLIISIIMVFVGGFFVKIVDPSASDSGRGFFPELLTTGLQWGGIIFIIGSVVSFISAFMSKNEIAANRKKLTREVISAQNKLKNDSTRLQQEYDKAVLQYHHTREDKLRKYRDDAAELEGRKSEHRAQVVEKFNAEKEKVLEGLSKVYNS